MKNYVLALAVFAAVPAQAGDLWLDINGFSQHSKDTYWYLGKKHKYNESNPGLGLTYRANKWLDFSAGFYENSYYHTTVYGAVRIGYEIALGDVVISPGLQSGFATGYEKTPVSSGLLRPFVFPSLRIAYRNIGVTIGYFPKITQPDIVAISIITMQVNIELGKQNQEKAHE